MAMRETQNSLRWYLGLVGLLSAWGFSVGVKVLNDPIALAIMVLQGLIALGYLAFAFTLPSVLRTKPGLLVGFLIATLVFVLGLTGYQIMLAGGIDRLPPSTLSVPVIQIAITLYLIFNVRRLAHEATAPERRAATFD